MAKSNADTSAGLVDYTTPDSGDFTIQERGGIDKCTLGRIDTVIAHTATDKGYVRVIKGKDGTTRRPLLIPFYNTVGFAKGEDVVTHGKGYTDVTKELKENDILKVAGQFEVASKDQGALLHLIYGGNNPPSMYDQYPDHWVRHATAAPTVDQWSHAFTLDHESDGMDPNMTYAHVGSIVEPGDTQGAIAFRCYPKNDETWKRGFVIVEGEYMLLDCPVFRGNINYVTEQYNGIATVVSNIWHHFKELG